MDIFLAFFVISAVCFVVAGSFLIVRMTKLALHEQQVIQEYRGSQEYMITVTHGVSVVEGARITVEVEMGGDVSVVACLVTDKEGKVKVYL